MWQDGESEPESDTQPTRINGASPRKSTNDDEPGSGDDAG